MSSYAESYSKGMQASAQNKLSIEFEEQYPSIAQMFHGQMSPDGAQCLVPPASINLFVEGSQMKFCINPKTGNRVAFGCIPDPSKGFDALEVELAKGRFEWKISKRRN